MPITSGTREFGGHLTAYDLHTPLGPFPAPFALLIHGFASHKGTLAGHAAALCSAGFVVLNADMSSLFSPTLEAAQLRNVDAAAAHVEWALSLHAQAGGGPLADPARVCLCGHSAGGAVALEACVALRGRGVAVARLCLLDGVPWPRTLGVARGLLAAGPTPPPRVLSLRAEPGAWNRNAAVVDALRAARAAAGAGAPPITDALLVGSGHGDPINPPQRGLLVRLLGLLGPPRCAQLFAELLPAFLQAREGAALAAAGAQVRVAEI